MSKRERQYAKTRYDKWAAKQRFRAHQSTRRRRDNIIAGVALLVIAVVGVGSYLVIGSAPFSPTAPAAASTTASGCGPAASASSTDFGKTAPDPSLAQGRDWAACLGLSTGKVEATLNGAAAPKAVASFVHLAQADFFTGVPCHRLTTQGLFVLQCGDPTGTGSGGPGYSFGPVENAPKDNLYPAGTLAMARVGDQANSMGSQFFIVYKDTTLPADSAGGYTVFGKITSGLETITKVAQDGVKPGANGAATTDGEPVDPVTINSVTVK